ncbi:MAG: S4 domain-containing protein [Sulfobacillus sp.]
MASRLDKFLQLSRLVKRRTLAKELADAGRVLLNEKTAKASADVAVGDRIQVRIGNWQVEATVLMVPSGGKVARGAPLVEILERSQLQAVDE